MDLIAALGRGLPLTSRPYRDLGRTLGMSEDEVIAALGKMLEDGSIKRLGVIVRHRELGYRANAMVVWDIADDAVAEVGRRFAEVDFVTLCYRRRRRPPEWPYNLFCMIHGREKDRVLAKVEQGVYFASFLSVEFEIVFAKGGRRWLGYGVSLTYCWTTRAIFSVDGCHHGAAFGFRERIEFQQVEHSGQYVDAAYRGFYPAAGAIIFG